MSGLAGPLSWEQTALLGGPGVGIRRVTGLLACISFPVDHTVFGVFYLFWLPASSILSPYVAGLFSKAPGLSLNTSFVPLSIFSGHLLLFGSTLLCPGPPAELQRASRN